MNFQSPQSQVVLSGHGLVKHYGSVVGLAGVDMAVRSGEALAVMGPSGNGKTTLLHVLAGILTPDQGEVWLAGERVDQLNDAARTVLRRRRLGFVFQDNQLLAELPADENVALPLMVDGLNRREAIGRARNVLAQVGLAAEVGRRPGELSGGQAQRVAIARALVGEPQVVFADEPTGALDAATGSQVIELLVGAATYRGAAVVVVTHDNAVAARCHRTLHIVDGRVSEGSTPAQPFPTARPATGPAPHGQTPQPNGHPLSWGVAHSESQGATPHLGGQARPEAGGSGGLR